MAIVINGSGTVTGLAVGGLPDDSVDEGSLANSINTSIGAKLPLAGGSITGNVNFGDNVKAQFGDANDLNIYHNGTHSIVQDSGSGDLKIWSSKVEIQSPDAGENIAIFNDDGDVQLYHNNALKLATVSNGIKVTDRVTGSADLVLATVDSNEKIHMDSDGYIKLETNGSERMRIDAAGKITLGGETALGHLNLVGLARPSGNQAYVSQENATKAQGGLNWYQSTTSPYHYFLDMFGTATAESSSYGGSQLRFLTTPFNSATAVERLRITNTGVALSQFTAKVWARVDMSNMDVPDSYNVSSVSDIATGNARLNLGITFGNSSYNISTSAVAGYIAGHSGQGTSSFHLRVSDTNGSAADADYSMALAFGD